MQWGVALKRDDSAFRDRLRLAPFPSSGERTPSVTTSAGLEVAFTNPMEGCPGPHIFPSVTTSVLPPFEGVPPQRVVVRAELAPIVTALAARGARRVDSGRSRILDGWGGLAFPLAASSSEVWQVSERPVQQS